ncbi:hypothetical protein Pmani_015523 [Petrolisthes manimaculis]|uniref:C2H2-type domain-containing protein n=1 Tax=Petrolisthes manimaculis TaxID=1843537 RepID=A0AAE1U7L1_9EUCA|nr:hypothetical protein Pmani_015523 [Petrolisthes manimaculis]
MGEHGQSTLSHQHDLKETVTCIGVGEYTSDWFVCGLCGAKTSDIERYVSHMMLTEHCVLHLCPSAAITDLLLPRFTKKQKRMEGEDMDIKNAKDLVGIIDEEGLDEDPDGDNDVKEVVPASEVETGGERRWKCRLCGLTFSRQAAVLNHFKLQHMESCTPQEEGEEKVLPQQDAHIKRESPVNPHAPVKHILVMETKPEPQNTQAAADKIWDKLACQVCEQTFKTSKILQAHEATVHSTGRPFPCLYEGCPHAFKTKGSLKRHQRRHTGERPFACPDCGRCFRESGSLARHQRARGLCMYKTDAEIPRYGTDLPLNSHIPTERKPALSEHKLALHLKLKQELQNKPALHLKLKQEMQHKPLKLKQELQHKPTLQLKLKQELLAPHTDDTTTRDWSAEESKAGLKVSHFVKMEPPHPSPCSSSSSSPGQLVPCKLEMPPAPPSPPVREEEDPDDIMEPPDMNSEEDIKPPQHQLLPDILRKSFTCPLCCQSYARRSTLTLHMKIHLEQLGEECGECGKTFSCRSALFRHLASHSSLRQFECRMCHKTFKLLSHARAHLPVHTHTRSIPCRHCGRVYKTKSARNVHERTHTDSSAFSCIECHKSFTSKASLIRHIRTHTGETPFLCPYCNRGFKEHGTLSRHLKHKMPCARQASLEVETGDVGIRLLPGTPSMNTVKEEQEVTAGIQSPSPPSIAWTPLQSSPTPSSSIEPEDLPPFSPTSSDLLQTLEGEREDEWWQQT